MRDSEYKAVASNKAAIIITSTVYDRRALDTTCDQPLVNSLNHLTYLASTSNKVRESLCNDGGLERLIAILKECSKDRSTSPFHEPKSIAEEKKDALIAWKWTLTFQCLVLIGTRGSEAIRKRVVQAGLMPILATVLDNYLLIHRSFDALRDCQLETTLVTTLVERIKENGHYDRIERALEKNNCSKSDIDIDITKLLKSKPHIRKHLDTTILTYGEKQVEFKAKNNAFRTDLEDEDMVEDSLMITEYTIQTQLHDINNTVSSPRTFLNGTLIPKDDDVVWALQLLAFISKYSCMKPDLQNTSIVNALSFRHLLKFNAHYYEEVSKRPGTALISKQSVSGDSSVETIKASVTPVIPFSKSTIPLLPLRSESSDFLELKPSTDITERTSTTHSSSCDHSELAPTGVWEQAGLSSLKPSSAASDLLDDDPQGLSDSYSSQIEPLTQTQSTQSILSQSNSSDEMLALTEVHTDANDDTSPPTSDYGKGMSIERLSDDLSFEQKADIKINNADLIIENVEESYHFEVMDENQLSSDLGSIGEQDLMVHNDTCTKVEDELAKKDLYECKQRELMSEEEEANDTVDNHGHRNTEEDPCCIRKNLRNALRELEKCCSLPFTDSTDKKGKIHSFINFICQLNYHYCTSQINNKIPEIKRHQKEKREYLSKWNYKTYFLKENASQADKDQSLVQKLLLNIFPMVEKFTNKLESTTDMCYWSGVVMRNSCRKDETRGGVRQCAYFKCGKWEDYPRQFAKCRRCKRTKYCSKECQLQAWGFHKYWCVDSSTSSCTSSNQHRQQTNADGRARPAAPTMPLQQNQEQLPPQPMQGLEVNVPGTPFVNQGLGFERQDPFPQGDQFQANPLEAEFQLDQATIPIQNVPAANIELAVEDPAAVQHDDVQRVDVVSWR